MNNIVIDFSARDLYNYTFIPLIKNKKRYLFLKGWWGSGKSVFEAQNEIIKSFQKKDKTMCVRKIKDTLKDSVYSELKKVIKVRWLNDKFEILKSPLSITNKITWCEFIFRGIDDPEKIKSVEWINRIRIEEATELTREDFDQLDLRLRWKENMQIVCTFNPVDVDSRINKDIRSKWENEDTTLHSSTYVDNRFVWPEYKKVMERLLETNKNYYNIYALWKWWVLEWLVFDNWEVIQDIPAEAKLLWYWQDFWYTNDPTTLVAIYMWNNCIILDEIFYEQWLTNQDIAQRYADNNIGSYDDIYCDSSEPKSIEELHREWYNTKPVEKWPDSINYGINVMKQYKIYITSRSWNWQKEFRKYVWAKDKNGNPLNKPIDAFNHFIDASRYWCMMLLWKKKEYDVLFL